MSNSLTPTTVNIPSSQSHTLPLIPSRRIHNESICHKLSKSTSSSHSPTHDTTTYPPSTTPPKKRSRISHSENMTVEHASSISDTSSQSGMADNETEAERSQQSEVSAPTAPAAKKKRTRTLTTPHQSAVLHALLAKSRFPTTVMREEVGRQIGLSARKVQIWFQNQRQKARRPQSDSAPLSRPPQFGPFPSVPPSASSSHTAPMSESVFPDTPEASASQTTVPESGRSLDPGLSGPGIPGRHISPYPSSAEEYPRHEHASPEPSNSIANRSSRVAQEFPSLTLREPAPRLLAPRQFLMHESEQSPPSSRVLPPIYSTPLESRISTDPYVPSTSSSQLSHSSPSIMHLQVPTSHRTEHSISTALGISPPFALQPQPQWDPHSFIPYTRPDFASFLPSAARGGISILGTRDRVVPHVSPDSARRMEYYPSSSERIRPPSSQARPYTHRDMVDSSPGLPPTRSRHLPSSSLSRLDALRSPREYPSHQPSFTGNDGMHSDDDEPTRHH
ncbi:homeobox-domain-containing protein [Rhizopogon vinicolor AM-OR11-026]|uniref:Homeobox-domain-containing protein n=1 Tax=Rhizopogon vinicolor AM-OR11-026 TaxID=1314800 RepID=A0A1B7MPM8_9AGAM|nr:homeobox-domain-containing protein [Rhizopogon vinicolor AM-OR11-026]